MAIQNDIAGLQAHRIQFIRENIELTAKYLHSEPEALTLLGKRTRKNLAAIAEYATDLAGSIDGNGTAKRRGRPPKANKEAAAPKRRGRPPKATKEATAPKRRGRPPKAATEAAAPKRRGRPPKAKLESVPGENAAPKRRGRPPKDATASAPTNGAPKRRGRPPKVKLEVVSDADQQAPKKRGRPPKAKPPESPATETASEAPKE